jgi:hypothetical protein
MIEGSHGTSHRIRFTNSAAGSIARRAYGIVDKAATIHYITSQRYFLSILENLRSLNKSFRFVFLQIIGQSHAGS